MYGTNVGPALVSAITAYAVEAIRRKEYASKYLIVNAAEVFVSAWAGNMATTWLPDQGFIGLGSTISSAAIAGVIYAVARRYIQDERDMKMANFGYGAGLALAGELIAAPFFTAIGSTYINLGAVKIEAAAPKRGDESPLPSSNVDTPPGSATPANTTRMGGGGVNNPCMWFRM